MLSLTLRRVSARSTATAAASRRYLRTTAPWYTTNPNNEGNKTPSPSNVSHTTDSYAKDVDDSPAVDQQIHRVDSFSENVQKPYEAPSGEWSRAGIKTSEYTNTNKSDQPYAPPEPEGEKQRYGGTKTWSEDKGKETSRPGQGPTGSDAGGRH